MKNKKITLKKNYKKKYIKKGGKPTINNFDYVMRLRAFILHHWITDELKENILNFTFCDKPESIWKVPIYKIYVYSRLHFNYKKDISGFFTKNNIYTVSEYTDLNLQKKKDTDCYIHNKKFDLSRKMKKRVKKEGDDILNCNILTESIEEEDLSILQDWRQDILNLYDIMNNDKKYQKLKSEINNANNNIEIIKNKIKDAPDQLKMKLQTKKLKSESLKIIKKNNLLIQNNFSQYNLLEKYAPKNNDGKITFLDTIDQAISNIIDDYKNPRELVKSPNKRCTNIFKNPLDYYYETSSTALKNFNIIPTISDEESQQLLSEIEDKAKTTLETQNFDNFDDYLKAQIDFVPNYLQSLFSDDKKEDDISNLNTDELINKMITIVNNLENSVGSNSTQLNKIILSYNDSLELLHLSLARIKQIKEESKFLKQLFENEKEKLDNLNDEIKNKTNEFNNAIQEKELINQELYKKIHDNDLLFKDKEAKLNRFIENKDLEIENKNLEIKQKQELIEQHLSNINKIKNVLQEKNNELVQEKIKANKNNEQLQKIFKHLNLIDKSLDKYALDIKNKHSQNINIYNDLLKNSEVTEFSKNEKKFIDELQLLKDIESSKSKNTNDKTLKKKSKNTNNKTLEKKSKNIDNKTLEKKSKSNDNKTLEKRSKNTDNKTLEKKSKNNENKTLENKTLEKKSKNNENKTLEKKSKNNDNKINEKKGGKKKIYKKTKKN